MKDLMNRVYGLTNLALLTPQNLVENIQLENYLEIKYYKDDKEIICEMITEDDGEEIRYIYHFSKSNQLQALVAVCGKEHIEMFDRNTELQVLLDEYDNCVKVRTA